MIYTWQDTDPRKSLPLILDTGLLYYRYKFQELPTVFNVPSNTPIPKNLVINGVLTFRNLPEGYYQLWNPGNTELTNGIAIDADYFAAHFDEALKRFRDLSANSNIQIAGAQISKTLLSNKCLYNGQLIPTSYGNIPIYGSEHLPDNALYIFGEFCLQYDLVQAPFGLMVNNAVVQFIKEHYIVPLYAVFNPVTLNLYQYRSDLFELIEGKLGVILKIVASQRVKPGVFYLSTFQDILEEKQSESFQYYRR